MEESADLTTRRAQTTLRRDVQPAVFGPRVDLTATAHHVHGEPKPWADVIAAPFEPFPIGERWGAAWETTWFRFTGTVPAEWRGAEVVVRLGLGHRGQPGFGAEGLVWEQGTPIQGISSRHDCYHLFPKAEGGEAIDVLLEAAANPIADLDLLPAPSLMPDYGGQPLFRLDRAEAVVYRRDVQALAVDMGVLLDLLRFLPADQPRAHEVRRALNLACNALDPADVVGTATAAREVLADVLSRPAMASAHTLTAVGNAHIDTAWLWPLRETIRKAARTFSSALRLMDEYDDYHFACSQPQQLAWVKERYPELFARIKAKVATGQFEPVGSMWVEPDCNVTSGESLVRQILHGSLFWQEEFGIETGEVWLPDVFGYSASMPQIMRRAGIHRFLTQKLSWSTVNKIPNHTLWWEGIDGSRVFAHFPPAETYGGNFDMAELDRAVRNFRDHGRASRSLYLFGWGDGGGGPTREMLERAHRYRDLEGAPRVALADVNTFWADAEADVDADELAVWAGELYLEYHRGTYTTSAMSKRENRTLELLLREAELWSSVSGRGGGWASYPAVDLDQAWKDLLLLQFHDVLPGTSIHWVYEDSAEIYARVRAVAVGRGVVARCRGHVRHGRPARRRVQQRVA
jgi:alpha-mannosidase